jgi:hypothetical protein
MCVETFLLAALRVPGDWQVDLAISFEYSNIERGS